MLIPFSDTVLDHVWEDTWQEYCLSAEATPVFSQHLSSRMDLQTLHDAAYDLMCAINLTRDINPAYKENSLDVPYEPLPISETLLRFLPHSSALFDAITTPSKGQPNTPWNHKLHKTDDKKLRNDMDDKVNGRMRSTPSASKNGVRKSASAKKKESKKLTNDMLLTELMAKTRKMGPWSQFFKSTPGIEEQQLQMWQHVLRPTNVRQQEARERGQKIELSEDEVAAGFELKEEESWYPKRSINSFLLYRRTFQDFAKEHFRDGHHDKISVIAGWAWALEPLSVKVTFEAMAQFDFICLVIACPRYKFVPMPKTKPTKQLEKETGPGPRSGLSLSTAATTRRPHCRPDGLWSRYQSLCGAPSGQLNGNRLPPNTDTLNYVYWKAPNYPIGARARGLPAMNNYYFQSGTLSNGLSASSWNINHYQLPIDNLLNDFMTMGIKTEPGVQTETDVAPFIPSDLNHLAGSKFMMHSPYPMIAQQPDGLTVGGGCPQLDYHTAPDDIRWDDYIYVQ